MCKVVVVTNRKLVKGDFLELIARISEASPAAIILREKDLSESDYEVLARQVYDVCRGSKTPLILHTCTHVSDKMGLPVHLPFSALDGEVKTAFGVSCHSPLEAIKARSLGAKYVTAGHIFETDCKKGLAGRGLSFLRETAASVDIPVLAIGGIDATNAREVIAAGASGICVMSGAMTADNIYNYIETLKSI